MFMHILEYLSIYLSNSCLNSLPPESCTAEEVKLNTGFSNLIKTGMVCELVLTVDVASLTEGRRVSASSAIHQARRRGKNLINMACVQNGSGGAGTGMGINTI